MKLNKIKCLMAVATMALFSNGVLSSDREGNELEQLSHRKHFEDGNALYTIPVKKSLVTHELDFLSPDSPAFDKRLLSEARGALGKSVGDSFSNIATVGIVFHCWSPGVGVFELSFQGPSKYVSGGKTINDEGSKEDHGLVCANPDFISSELSKNIAI